MKKIMSVALCAIMLVLSLASCGIVSKVENAVVYPDTYSITYEITTTEGLIHTITKTVDEKGNIYFKSIDDEKLFINNGGSYSLYKKDTNGKFVAVDGAKYTLEAIEKELALFESYVRKTTDKFIPTARHTGDTTVAGRTSNVYKIGVNLLAASFYHIYYVDQDTGVCLGVDVVNKAFGNETKDNEETFVCVEFITSNIENLTNKFN